MFWGDSQPALWYRSITVHAGPTVCQKGIFLVRLGSGSIGLPESLMPVSIRIFSDYI